MKKVNIPTSKGSFLVVDIPKNYYFKVYYNHLIIDSSGQGLVNKLNKASNDPTGFLKVMGDFYKLSEITEEQASGIVEDINDKKFIRYSDYTRRCNSAIESLHSLIKSKGIHLFQNPYDEAWVNNAISQYPYSIEEQKTFYNPYIFELYE